ncbi:MAG: hypothetical protein HZY79_06480 [Rhodoblastus sp.]|nr:MAG: hypothetical protein HZY79_06480 [Rhodoblastus sp.]
MVLALVLAGANARAEPACRVAGDASAAIVEVTKRFEITLDDGRTIRLAGLAPPRPDFVGSATAEAARAAATAEWAGRPVLVKALAGPDRWGRTPALLEPVEGGADVGSRLLALGAAVVGDSREGGAGGADCPAARLAAEMAARKAGVGLWSESYYGVQQAADRDGLLARAGTFALVEGTVRRVGTGRLRLYLDFGAGRDGFSVTVTTRMIRAFEAAGMDLRGLTGRRLRVRGVVETYEGRDGAAPRMELSGPGALELLDGGAP